MPTTNRSAICKVVLLCSAALGLSLAPAEGATLSNQRLTKDAPPQQGCVTPNPVTTFIAPSDGTAYLWFDATVTTSDHITNQWIQPDGQVYTSGGWPTLSGTYCFIGASLNLATLPSSLFGSWQARVLDNGVPQFSLPFTISSPPPPSSGGPPQAQPNLTSSCYTHAGGNPFDLYGASVFYCTRYAWGRACEKTGAHVSVTGNAWQWYSQAQAGGWAAGGSPRPNSIAVWSGGPSTIGHVAFVEDVNSNGVTITEANYCSPQCLTYNGSRTIPSSQMASRGGMTLLGYIYVTPYEGYVDTNSSTCSSTVSGWLADRSRLNTPISVDIFDGTTRLGSAYANVYRSDVANYLHDNGDHGFSFAIPGWIADGRTHTLWAQATGTTTDLTGVQPVTCSAGSRHANVTFAPMFPVASGGCYTFTFTGTETNGVGVNLTTFLIIPENYSYSLPALGIPNRLNPDGTFSTGLKWCRTPGMSFFSITGTDDMGASNTWSTSVQFQ